MNILFFLFLILDSYRNTLMKKAEHTLSTAIPDQLEELEQLLKDSKFQTS